MKRLLLTLWPLITLLPTMAQESNISGRTIDTESTPIMGVTVVMFATDSTYLSSAVTDHEGRFTLPNTEPPFRLVLSHLSYQGVDTAFESAAVGDIVMLPSTQQIDEVTIKAYRPVVKAEEGKLSYDLTQLSEQTTATNVYDALSYLPGVDEKDGALSLAGVGATTVIINGKPSTMSAEQLETLLRSMPIERIKSAEVMYSTPPQYGVRGASINLVLEQSRDHSYSGQVESWYARQRDDSWGGSGSFMVSTPKWSADALYSYGNFYSPQVMELTTQHTVGSQTKLIEQYEDIYSYGERHSLRAAIDYTPNEGTSLSLAYNGKLSPTQNSVSDSKGSYVESVSDKEGDEYLHNVALRYKAASGFDIGADYTTYRNSSDGVLENLYSDDTATSFDVSSGQQIQRLNLYTDMAHTLGEGWGITYGAKATWAEDADYQRYSAVAGGVETFDTDSRLTEMSAELYGGFSKSLAKGSVSASLTSEYYNLEGDERWMLYPQANFMWMFDQDNIVQANISSDKTYPSYWMLQNAISYVDGYTELHGNPMLRPMREYSAQAIYIHKQRYIFVLFGSQTNDYFTQNAYLAPDRFSLIYKNTNFDYSRQYGVNAIIPLSMGEWLTSKVTLVGMRMDQKCSDFYGTSFDCSVWMGVAQVDNTIQLAKNLSLELNGTYQSPAIQGLFDLSHSWSVDAGLKWSLLDKKLNFTATCHDIFESQIPRVTQNWSGQKLEMYTGNFTRTLMLNLSYTLGGYTKKERREVDSSRFGH